MYRFNGFGIRPKMYNKKKNRKENVKTFVNFRTWTFRRFGFEHFHSDRNLKQNGERGRYHNGLERMRNDW